MSPSSASNSGGNRRSGPKRPSSDGQRGTPARGGQPSRGQARDGKPRGGQSRDDRSRDDRAGGGKPRSGQQRQGEYVKPEPPKREGWGRVARKGAESARRADERDQPMEPERFAQRPDPQERWERVDDSRPRAAKRQRTPKAERVEIELDESQLIGTAGQKARARERVGEAATAFVAERFEDARTILKPIALAQSHMVEVRELYGLTLYRLGRWSEAIVELEAVAALTGSSDQHPVRADAHRALGQHAAVERLWDELRHDHPDAATITEGRIVMAGSLADRDDLAGAIRLLEQGPVRTKVAREHHLRLWYALADLYERIGDTQKARRGFERVMADDRSFADVVARVRALD